MEKNHTMIVLKNQNIFDVIYSRINAKDKGSSVIVPHVCNNINTFGAGFAACVAQKFPEVKINFHMLGNKAKLGHVQFVTVVKNNTYKHEIIFANMIAQNKVLSKNNPRPLNYGALVYCMYEIKNHISDFTQKYGEKSSIEIHAPKFGSGLAGGNWNFISDLITDIWYNVPVYVYCLNSNPLSSTARSLK